MKYIHKIILPVGVAILSLFPSISNASGLNDSEAVETMGIFVRGLKICHQREWRNLSLHLEYDADIGGRASEVPLVKEHVRHFLEEYSNPDDYWEVMNRKLVDFLTDVFPDIKTLKSKLTLAPDRTLDFPRETMVEYERGEESLKETFSFTRLNYIICQMTFRSLNLQFTWRVKENPDPATDYPDYQWVNAAMEAFFKEYPVSFSNWKLLKPRLEAFLLDQFPSLASLAIEVMIVE